MYQETQLAEQKILELKLNKSNILLNTNRLTLNSLFKGKCFQVNSKSKVQLYSIYQKRLSEYSDSERLKIKHKGMYSR